ncbi:hypothetical protein RFI_10205 [Reticulomyxa filosa]|uniref:CAP-Gly domain-containing protein n=1 Tax=Reticulomyxa filosa TaxID=46433 RepID=X6NMM4_RETFI|nr:hypothetical protein RFI_10205 [Reticulomyxa filosa]|eukprot:ETO26929.1 hypothetical protein RFI_10205 [Reticulomyxa filosa]
MTNKEPIENGHDGKVNDIRYFVCENGKGKIVPIDTIIRPELLDTVSVLHNNLWKQKTQTNELQQRLSDATITTTVLKTEVARVLFVFLFFKKKYLFIFFFKKLIQQKRELEERMAKLEAERWKDNDGKHVRRQSSKTPNERTTSRSGQNVRVQHSEIGADAMTNPVAMQSRSQTEGTDDYDLSLVTESYEDAKPVQRKEQNNTCNKCIPPSIGGHSPQSSQDELDRRKKTCDSDLTVIVRTSPK